MFTKFPTVGRSSAATIAGHISSRFVRFESGHVGFGVNLDCSSISMLSDSRHLNIFERIHRWKGLRKLSSSKMGHNLSSAG